MPSRPHGRRANPQTQSASAENNTGEWFAQEGWHDAPAVAYQTSSVFTEDWEEPSGRWLPYRTAQYQWPDIPAQEWTELYFGPNGIPNRKVPWVLQDILGDYEGVAPRTWEYRQFTSQLILKVILYVTGKVTPEQLSLIHI